MAYCQIHPFDKSGIEPSRETHPLQAGLESSFGPQAHHLCNPNEPAPPIAFFHLTIDQARRHLPMEHDPPRTTSCEPASKMGREGIKIAIEAITGEERKATRSQHLSQGVDEQCAMCWVRGPRTSTGSSLVHGSMASQSHSTCLALHSRVRSSSNCRCGRCRSSRQKSNPNYPPLSGAVPLSLRNDDRGVFPSICSRRRSF